MLNFKSGQVSQKEKEVLRQLALECSDIYGDCYITKNNLRLFIRENISLIFDGLKKGDKLLFEDNTGFIYIYGWSDNANRKYLKILTKDVDGAKRLLQGLHWYIQDDLWCKVKKNNPVKQALERMGFRFAGDRGKEVLMFRKSRPRRISKEKQDERE